MKGHTMDGFRFSALLLGVSVLFLAGCGSVVNSEKKSAPAYTPGGGGGGTDAADPYNPPVGGGSSEVAGFFISLTSPAQITLHRANVQYDDAAGADTSNFSEDCRIQSTDAGIDRDKLCVAEVDELDLYFQDIKMQYHVPPSMCSYVSFIPYYFYAWEAGTGPGTVSYQVNLDGSIVDGANSVGGVPSCPYDHSGSGGPDCCVGAYTLTVNTEDPDNPGNYIPTITSAEWSGKISNCMSGPAKSASWSSVDQNGLPVPLIEYVEGVGLNTSFDILSAITQSFGESQLRSTVWSANYYDPTLHPSGVGAGRVVAGYEADRPVGMRIPDDVPLSLAYQPSDTYVVTCYDKAKEVLARIRLMIREWNTDTIVENGDPDDTGAEPGYPNEDLNDYRDWLDFETDYPGVSF